MSSKVAAVFSTLADRFGVSYSDLLCLEKHNITTCDDFYYNLSSEKACFLLYSNCICVRPNDCLSVLCLVGSLMFLLQGVTKAPA